MNRIRILGKSISATIVVMLLVVGIASAALVSYYTSTEGTVDVSGPLSISPSTYTLSLNASETITMQEVPTLNYGKILYNQNLNKDVG